MNIASILILLLGVYSLCIIAWLILTTLISFNMVNRQNRAVMLSTYYMNRLVGPPIRHLRRFLPNTGQLDIAPIVLLLLVGFGQELIAVVASGHNPLLAVIHFAAEIIQFIIYALIAQMVVSLLINFGIVNRHQRVVAAIDYALTSLCEPILAPARRFIPPLGTFDLAPLILIIVLGFVKNALLRLMFQL